MKTKVVNKKKLAPILLTAREEAELRGLLSRAKNLRRENRNLRKELKEITGGVV